MINLVSVKEKLVDKKNLAAIDINHLPNNLGSSSLPVKPSKDEADGLDVFLLTAACKKSNHMSVT